MCSVSGVWPNNLGCGHRAKIANLVIDRQFLLFGFTRCDITDVQSGYVSLACVASYEKYFIKIHRYL